MRKSFILVAVPAVLLAAACSADVHKPTHAAVTAAPGSPMDLTAEELKARKARLTKEQFHVTQEEGTEPAFRNAYWDNHAAGIYVDVVSGEPLFSSREKFDSGTGWPSFWQPIEPKNIVTKTDRSAFMSRTEVRSRTGGSHLGHVFDDGPAPTGMRYCMNSAALRFIPAERLAAEGYGSYAKLFPEVKPVGPPAPSPAGGAAAPAGPPFPPAAEKAAAQNRVGVAANLEVAVLGGGCFWGMEEMLRKLDGVVRTEVGYAGGNLQSPTYSQVSSGETGHAESVKLVFDPRKTTYEKVVKYFFHIHDPTTLNRQENDRGTQYRSVIFAQTPEQVRIASEIKDKLDRSHKLDAPLVTQIVPAMQFYSAEEYHQKYLVKHPNGYMCHYERKFEL